MIVRKILRMCKGIVPLLLVFALVPACDHASHDHSHNADDGAVLTLNDGERWLADDSTVQGVRRMQQIVGRSTGAADPDELRALGEELQQEHDRVIRECTMQGPAHEMLHVFLVDVSQAISDLKGEDEAAARLAAERLPELLSSFDENFRAEAL